MPKPHSIYHKTKVELSEENAEVEAAKKNPERFAPLYNRYYEQIFRYIYQRVDSQEKAGDIASQVFLKALQNLHKYKFMGVPFSSWLYRIAMSEVYQSFKDKKAERTINLDTMQLGEMVEECEEDNSDDRRRLLLDAISQLNEDDLQMVELRFFEKRSFREIGEILDVTENNAKVKSYRIIEKLKKIIIKS